MQLTGPTFWFSAVEAVAAGRQLILRVRRQLQLGVSLVYTSGNLSGGVL